MDIMPYTTEHANRNVEIKAKLPNVSAAHAMATTLSGGPGTVLRQKDVFYVTPKGRLKMRSIKEGKHSEVTEELIYYERPDTLGPKTSTFYKVDGSGVKGGLTALGNLLRASMGVRGEVSKKRTLYMVERTRVHIDNVHGLGDFLELEVLLTPLQTSAEGQVIAEDLMAKLGVKETDLLDCAYMDMLEKKQAGETADDVGTNDDDWETDDE